MGEDENKAEKETGPIKKGSKKKGKKKWRQKRTQKRNKEGGAAVAKRRKCIWSVSVHITARPGIEKIIDDNG
jgi:hypothetical protein